MYKNALYIYSKKPATSLPPEVRDILETQFKWKHMQIFFFCTKFWAEPDYFFTNFLGKNIFF